MPIINNLQYKKYFILDTSKISLYFVSMQRNDYE